MSEQTTSPERSSRAGKPIVKKGRWQLCDYFIAANYAPFTVAHVRELTGSRTLSHAQALIDNLIKLRWARETGAPDCKLKPADKNAKWYEMTSLGINKILASGHAKQHPLPKRYTRSPLYARNTPPYQPKQRDVIDERTPVLTGALAVAPRVDRQPDPAPQLVIQTPAGDVTLPAQAMRPVYEALKAIFG